MKKRKLIWFINRVGKEVIRGELSLFHPPIKIESNQHAKALYISQTKGYKFDE
jgi:hypothetical protein